MLLSVVLIAWLGQARAARGAVHRVAASGPHIRVVTQPAGSPSASFFPFGTPSSTAIVSGGGFSSGAHLEVFFDTADVASAVADASGAFAGVGVDIPVLAVPGTHWITVADPASGLSAQRAFQVATAWTEFRGGPPLAGLNPFENVVGQFDAGTLTKRWAGSTGGQVVSSPALTSFYNFVGSTDGKLYVFPAGCGGPACGVRWTMTTGGPINSSPALSGQFAYVGSGDGSLYAMNPSSCGSSVSCPPAWVGPTGGAITSSPAVSGYVYIGSADGNVYAFRSGGCGSPSCPPVWATATGGPVSSSPAVAFGKLYVGSSDGKVYALNPSTGAILWTTDTGAPVTSSPAVAQQPWSQPAVQVGSSNGKLFVLNAYTGALQWTGATGGAIESSPAVAYSDIYVGSDDGKLYAFNTVKCASPPCAPIWTAATGGAVTSSPLVANGVVYVGSADGKLYAFNARSGASLWTYVAGSPIESSPAISNGMLVVGADDGNLYGFRLAQNPTPPPRPNPLALVALPSPIRHVVVIYQENHSFDNVLGYLCVQDARCDGATTGTTADGTTVPLARAPDLVPVVDHTGPAQTTAVDGGLMDGFSRIQGCASSTGYACYDQYQPDQIPNLAALVRAFAISDRTFETDSVPSWGAHLDLGAARMDGFTGENPLPVAGVRLGPPTWGCDNNANAWWMSSGGSLVSVPSCIPKSDGSGPYTPSPVPWIPTIMDRLDAAGMSWRVYGGWGTYSVCPSFADCIYGPQRNDNVTSNQVLKDASTGSLPNLSLVVPGGANSQHNGWSMLQGDNWIGSVVGAIENGPEWRSTAIFITYDDCGCFYDHVPPPPGLGIRVPMVIVSPYAKAGFTDSNVASFASMLAYTEHAFGLQPLYTTDANAYGFSQSFDYTQAPLGPVPTAKHPIPKWEVRWLRLHPPDLRDPT